MVSQQQLPASMRALVWTAPRSMVMQEASLPQPCPGDLLLEVAAVGICGSELSGYLGLNSLRVPPLVMGHEFSARIVGWDGLEGTVLADSSPAQAGQLVAVNPLITCGKCEMCLDGLTHLCPQRKLVGAHRAGAFARYVAIPAAQCWPLPEGMSDVAGALVEPLACAVRAVGHAMAHTRGRRPGPLLILGAGTIGLCCLAVACAEGWAGGEAPIVVSDVMDERLRVAMDWGALTVNGRAAGAEQALREALAGGAAAAIEAAGISATRALAVQQVRPGGCAVFIGLHDETSPLAANYLVRQEIAVQGTYSYTAADFRRAIELLASGAVQPSAAWIDERPLDYGPEAFAGLVSGEISTPKIILRP
jgi:threonine dehydrogenase-like Zn-dependent dehydrogenase